MNIFENMKVGISSVKMVPVPCVDIYKWICLKMFLVIYNDDHEILRQAAFQAHQTV
jgi:hypothetical protein